MYGGAGRSSHSWVGFMHEDPLHGPSVLSQSLQH